MKTRVLQAIERGNELSIESRQSLIAALKIYDRMMKGKDSHREMTDTLRERMPERVSPGSINEYLYGCIHSDLEKSDVHPACTPTCMRGFSSDVGECDASVYSFRNDEMTVLNPSSATTGRSYLFIEEKDTSEGQSIKWKRILEAMHISPLIFYRKAGTMTFVHYSMERKTAQDAQNVEMCSPEDTHSQDDSPNTLILIVILVIVLVIALVVVLVVCECVPSQYRSQRFNRTPLLNGSLPCIGLRE